MRVGVFGAGSIGCMVGGRLAANGVDVVFYGRKRLADEVATHGMTLTRGSEPAIHTPAQYVTDLSALRDRDIVLVTVKSRDTSSAGAQLREVLAENARAVSLQNGVTNADALRGEIDHKVLAGMVPFNVLSRGDGRFHQGTSGTLVVERGGEDLTAALVAGGIPAKTHGDVPGILYGKLLINLNNALNGLSGLPLKEQLSDRRYRLLMADLIDEGRAVLRAAGIRPRGVGILQPWLVPAALRLPDWLFKRAARSMVDIDPQARSSLWEDLNRGRPTEVGDLNGEIVRIAERAGTDAPLNAAIVRLVQEAEGTSAGSPGLDPQTLRGLLH